MKKIIAITALITAAVVLNSCKKEFDTPPLKTPNEGAKTNIKRIKARVPSASANFKFTGDSSLFCTVIADETSGNLYKQVFVKDDAGDAIQVNLQAAGGLKVGDYIRINMNGIYALNVSSMITLDSVDVGKHIVKQSSGNVVTPITFTSITSINSSMQSQLVTITNVEFVAADKNMPYADAIGKGSINRLISVCGMSSPNLTVRTSGYANFAAVLTPTGSGSMTAIVTQYNSTMQFTIRDVNEVQLNNGPCTTASVTLPPGTYLLKDFEDGVINSGGWANNNVTATVNWAVKTATSSSSMVGECNNYLGTGNQPACETWFISPSVNLTTSSAPNFSFTSAGNTFSGPQMEVLVSTNYTGGAPSSATWTTLAPTLGGSSSSFVSSGLINFSAYKVSNVRVAFKYTGSLNSGRRWHIDNIRIAE